MDQHYLAETGFKRLCSIAWKQLNRVRNIRSRTLQDILNQYSDLFKDGMGTLQGTAVKIHIQQDARPRFFRARPVPYALKDKFTAELERLRKADVIEPVHYSDWAAPIVPVLKNDGSIRICGDFKQTINTPPFQTSTHYREWTIY